MALNTLSAPEESSEMAPPAPETAAENPALTPAEEDATDVPSPEAAEDWTSHRVETEASTGSDWMRMLSRGDVIQLPPEQLSGFYASSDQPIAWGTGRFERGGPSSSGQLESHYRQLELAHSDYATRAGTQREYVFWRSIGSTGVEWLLNRIPHPAHGELVSRAAAVVAEVCSLSAVPIVSLLDRPNLNDTQRRVCLLALSWISPADTIGLWEELENRIRSAFRSSDSDLREFAVSATASLSKPLAVQLLTDWLNSETDDDVREVIQDELRARQGR